MACCSAAVGVGSVSTLGTLPEPFRRGLLAFVALTFPAFLALRRRLMTRLLRQGCPPARASRLSPHAAGDTTPAAHAPWHLPAAVPQRSYASLARGPDEALGAQSQVAPSFPTSRIPQRCRYRFERCHLTAANPEGLQRIIQIPTTALRNADKELQADRARNTRHTLLLEKPARLLEPGAIFVSAYATAPRGIEPKRVHAWRYG